MSRSAARLALLVPALAALACTDAGTGAAPDAAAPPLVSIEAGDAQSGVIGRALPNPIVVKVTDASGAPIRRVVNFVVTRGGGQVFAQAVESNATTGLARNQWTLGRSLEPGANAVEVRGVDPVTGSFDTYATFIATGLPVPVGRVVLAAPASGLLVPRFDTATVSARLWDEEGAEVTGQRIVAFGTPDPTRVLVTSRTPSTDVTTLLLGREEGSARVVAVSETRRDTLALTITKPRVLAASIAIGGGPFAKGGAYPVTGVTMTGVGGRDLVADYGYAPESLVAVPTTAGLDASLRGNAIGRDNVFRPVVGGPYELRVHFGGRVTVAGTVTVAWPATAQLLVRRDGAADWLDANLTVVAASGSDTTLVVELRDAARQPTYRTIAASFTNDPSATRPVSLTVTQPTPSAPGRVVLRFVHQAPVGAADPVHAGTLRIASDNVVRTFFVKRVDP